MCVCSRAVRGTTGGVSLKSEQEDRKKTSPFDFFVTMISLVPFLLSSSSSSKVSRGHISEGTKYGKMKKIDGWDGKKHGKFFPFFCLSQMVLLNTKKKQREQAYRIASGTKRALLSARIRCGREKGAWAEVPERRE